MLESIRQFYDIAVDFCREHSEILMIGGAALVVLIILIAVIRHCTRGRRGDNLEFDEQRYRDELLGARAEKKEEAENTETLQNSQSAQRTLSCLRSCSKRSPGLPYRICRKCRSGFKAPS